jgi:hypothetical protein
MDESGLGIALNKTIRGPLRFRAKHLTAVGLVVAEDTDCVIIEQKDGRRLRIRGEDIIKRTVV